MGMMTEGSDVKNFKKR
jgi:hypothetical protein